MPCDFRGLVLWLPGGNLVRGRFWSKFWLRVTYPGYHRSVVSETYPEWCSSLVIYSRCTFAWTHPFSVQKESDGCINLYWAVSILWSASYPVVYGPHPARLATFYTVCGV